MHDHGIPAPGFRLPPNTRPGRVRLRVGDLDRSLAFYRGVLGFSVLERSGNVALLGTGGGALSAGGGAVAPGGGAGEPLGETLLEVHGDAGVRPAPPSGRFGLFHFAIRLPERAAFGRFLAHLRDSGVTAGMSDHSVSEALYLADPDGLGIEVYADRPRAEWAYGGPDAHELRMTTEPLDAGSVLRAGGGEAWSGMPAETTIGHVHLRVGGLEAGKAFYHEALGLDLTVWSYPGALFFSAGGYHHHLGINTWAGAAIGPPRPDEACLLSWELLVRGAEAVQAALGSLERAGYGPREVGQAREGSGGAPQGAPAEKVWNVADPWGSELRITTA